MAEELEHQERSLEYESGNDCSASLFNDAQQPNPPKEKAAEAPTSAEKNPSIEKAQTPKDPVEKQKVDSLKDLLGPTVGTWWNDHRTKTQMDESDKRQLTAPLTKEELGKAREILGLAKDQTADETRKAIAKTIGLPESAKDADIRKKLSKQHDYNSGNDSQSRSLLDITPIDRVIRPELKRDKK